MAAAASLFSAIGAISSKSEDQDLDLPRLRFHWMVKNISGIWATGNLTDYRHDENRRVGRLSADATGGLAKERLLEVLYCECCGTQLLSGFRIPLDGARTELSFLPANPEQLPDDGSVVRTDEAAYDTIGVIYLRPDSEGEEDSCVEWEQGSSSRSSNGRPNFRAPAAWKAAKYDFETGVVTVGSFACFSETEVSCWFFELDAAIDQQSRYKAMPQKCPQCLSDYFPRNGGRYSPIRAFATGL